MDEIENKVENEEKVEKKPLPKQLYTKVDVNLDTDETIPADYPGIRGIISAIEADGYLEEDDYKNIGVCACKEEYEKDDEWHSVYYFCFTEPLWIIYNYPEIWEYCTEERPGGEDEEKYPKPGEFGCRDLDWNEEEEDE